MDELNGLTDENVKQKTILKRSATKINHFDDGKKDGSGNFTGDYEDFERNEQPRTKI